MKDIVDFQVTRDVAGVDHQISLRANSSLCVVSSDIKT